MTWLLLSFHSYLSYIPGSAYLPRELYYRLTTGWRQYLGICGGVDDDDVDVVAAACCCLPAIAYSQNDHKPTSDMIVDK